MSTHEEAWREFGEPSLAGRAGTVLARLSASLAAILDEERGRWALWVPVLFGCGIAVYFALPREPSWAVSFGIALAAAAARVVFRRPTAMLIMTSILCSAAFGFVAAKVRTEIVNAPSIIRPTHFVTVSGWVENWEKRAGKRNRLTLRLTSIEGFDAAHVPHRIRISATWPEGPALGSAVLLRAKLYPPPEPVAPGAFDFARRAYFQGLGGVGFAVSTPQPVAEAASPPLDLWLRARVQNVRQAIARRISAVLSRHQAAVAQALIIGDRAGLTEDVLTTLRHSGLAHILAISGLHMAIMAGSLFWLLRVVLTLTPGVALRYPVKKWAAGAALAGALAYLMISGGAIATQRAFLMVTVMFAAVILDRPALTLRNVMVAALVILALMPESLLDVSFQMSFAAAIALVAIYERWTQRLVTTGEEGRPAIPFWVVAYLAGIATTTIVASFAVAPFAAYHFHQFTKYGVLANVLAMPVVSILVMPMALVALLAMPFGLEAVPLYLMGQGIDAVLGIAASVAALPGAVEAVPAYSAAGLALMALGGLWLSIWRQRWHLLGLAMIAAGIALATAYERPDILIEREGKVVAVRDGNGLLAATPGRSGRYSLAEWLEADGDGRAVKDVRRSRAFRCDRHSCVTATHSLTVSVVTHAAALAEDCDRADILITPLRIKEKCKGPLIVITGADLREKGAHAIYLRQDSGQTRLTVRTTAQARGLRPWFPASISHDASQRQARQPPTKRIQ